MKLNRFCEKNPESFRKLLDIVRKFPKNYAQMITSQRRPEVLGLDKFIEECLENEDFGQFKYEISLKTKIYFIIAGKAEFPTCSGCGKTIFKNVLNLDLGFNHHKTQHDVYCSQVCKNQASRFSQTLSEVEKLKFRDKDFKEEIIKRREMTSFERHGDKCFRNVKKSRNTSLQHFGVDNPMKSEAIKKKAERSCFEKFGVKNPFMAQSCKNKIKETTKLHFGVDISSQSPLVQMKMKESKLKNYGTCSPSWTYAYDGCSFDSGWELCYYVWLVDAGIKFKYPSGISIKYLDFEGKSHFYYPDFLVEDELVEIKGKQFIGKDGVWLNPFGHGNEHEDMLMRSKQKCLLENNVMVLSENDMKFFTSYVEARQNVKNYMLWVRNFKNKT